MKSAFKLSNFSLGCLASQDLTSQLMNLDLRASKDHTLQEFLSTKLSPESIPLNQDDRIFQLGL